MAYNVSLVYAIHVTERIRLTQMYLLVLSMLRYMNLTCNMSESIQLFNIETSISKSLTKVYLTYVDKDSLCSRFMILASFGMTLVPFNF